MTYEEHKAMIELMHNTLNNKPIMLSINTLQKRDKQEKLAGRPRAIHCDCCNEYVGRTVWDHCHTTGKFRGWLCNRCNVGMGYVDDENFIKLANIYKAKFKPR